MRAALWKLLRGILFRMDAETAHRLTLSLIRLGTHPGGAPLRIASGAERRHRPESEVQALGMKFRSRVGLAAGFDKDAEILTALPSLGFGFAEIGTVTPRPQPGNERPRLFRDPSRRAIFNRMGFNGLGAAIVSRNLRAALPGLPEGFQVGVNIGKNKDTSLEDAASDYSRAAAEFEGLASYLVINVSSPNTPGLRSLQTAEALRPIVGGVGEVISKWKRRPPLLLKLAPEVRGEELAQLMPAVEAMGIDGWVLTNTLSGKIVSGGHEYAGGWSGGLLTEESLSRLREARAISRLPLISVGGIMSPRDALDRIRAGADLVQVYSGWIYGGPSFPAEIGRFIAENK